MSKRNAFRQWVHYTVHTVHRSDLAATCSRTVSLANCPQPSLLRPPSVHSDPDVALRADVRMTGDGRALAGRPRGPTCPIASFIRWASRISV